MADLRRRDFLGLLGGAAVWPFALNAQERKVPRIGVLLAGSPSSFAPRTEAFLAGLQSLGYVDGRTITIDWRWGQDSVDRLPELSADLVQGNVDVIVTGGTPAAKALQNATRSIPIVMAIIGDPVAAGLVESLARPGGNATGFSIVAPDLSAKRLQVLKEIVPGLSSVAVLLRVENPQSEIELREMQTGARALDLQLHPMPVSADISLEAAFETIGHMTTQALMF
jgi:ABC-type uncharacterized transport system substrate-binding protein